MQIKNEESRSGGLVDSKVDSKTGSNGQLANGDTVGGPGAIGSGDLGNESGGGVDDDGQDKEFVKEKQLKKPSFVVGASRAWQDVGKF